MFLAKKSIVGLYSIHAALAGALLLGSAFATTANAADKVRAGQGTGDTWAYLPLQIGADEGIFAKYDIDAEVSVMPGGAKLQQALASDSLDIGLAGSQAMALTIKGSPVIAIADLANGARGFSVVVAADSPIKTVADLKGKTISFGTNGSFPDWLVRRLSLAEGWGRDGLKGVALGSADASISAALSHSIDAMMTGTEVGLLLEEKKQGRVITEMGKYAPTVVSFAVFAGKSFVANHPDEAKRFLQGLFATIAFMKANKEKTIADSTAILHQSPTVMAKAYDTEIPTLSDDGHFDPAGMEVLRDSFIELGILSEKPRDDQILTTQFLPVKP